MNPKNYHHLCHPRINTSHTATLNTGIRHMLQSTQTTPLDALCMEDHLQTQTPTS